MPPTPSLAEFVEGLFTTHGLDLRGYKPSTLERRIRKRMAQLGVSEYAAYTDVLRMDPGEEKILLNTILINVTEFFRDPQAWECLRTEGLPRMLRKLRAGDTLRCWSAGCANGEEPYSLAILLSELLGSRLGEIDVKIYGTDIDEESLTLARRGDYTAHGLRRVPPQLRERYFTGAGPYRIHRDLRRMVIFGRSNMLLDAPISHCNIIVCRNLLIYFDPEAQRQVVSKLHYALEPGGVLFLGSAESKLNDSKLFEPLNARWRIFQKRLTATERNAEPAEQERWGGDPMETSAEQKKMQQELNRLRLHQRYLLETLKSSVLVLDAEHVITSGNDATEAVWGIPPSRLVGRSIETTELGKLCPELWEKLGVRGSAAPAGQQAKLHPTVEMQCRSFVSGEERIIAVIVRPITGDEGEWNGSLIYAEDMTYRKRLQQTVSQLENTSGELQSANEELETTNEELQSTNEELETTNEELQSTNEELETTNEELQSVNEELENMNEELESRTRELNALSSRYAETLQRMPWPVLLVDRVEKIQIWNNAAQLLLDVHPSTMANLSLDRLPIDPAVLRSILRCARKALLTSEAGLLKDQVFHPLTEEAANAQTFDLHFTPILQQDKDVEGVLIMFGPSQAPGKRTRKKDGTVGK